MAIKMTRGSGNVFRDLGFSETEAERLRMRADLMLRVQQTIRARRLKQAEAAKLLGVRQPRISDLMRGRLHLVSMETLIDMLGRLGIRVRLVMRPARRKSRVPCRPPERPATPPG